MGGIQGLHPGEHLAVALRQEFEVFDRNPDPALDELTELSAVLSNADYAYIGWMDFNRLWFKSRFGFKASEQPRSTTACQWLLQMGQPLLIPDAGEDARFPPTGVPLLGGKNCRSYAGVPLISSAQQVIGTLAVLAREPGRFNAQHITLLEVLGRQVVTRLELYARIRAQEQAVRARQRTERALAIERCFVAATLDSVPALVAVLDTSGRTVRLNHSCAQLTGLSLADAVGRPFVDDVLEPDDRPWASTKLHDAATGQVSGPHETAWRVAGGQSRRVSWTLRPLQGPNGEIQYLIVSGQDSSSRVPWKGASPRLTLSPRRPWVIGPKRSPAVSSPSCWTRTAWPAFRIACAPWRSRTSGRARSRCGAATESIAASPAAAAGCNCPASVRSSSSTAPT
jgi:PAS domain S-box-containing protein